MGALFVGVVRLTSATKLPQRLDRRGAARFFIMAIVSVLRYPRPSLPAYGESGGLLPSAGGIVGM